MTTRQSNRQRVKLPPDERKTVDVLQRYGAYIVDVSGSPLSIGFERDNTAALGTIGRTCSAAGTQWDYDGMTNIPWKGSKVLR